MSHAFSAVKMIRLIGGAVVLDFINTCNGRRPNSSLDAPQDRLNSFQFFFEWALHASLITHAEYEAYKSSILDSVFPFQPCLKSVVDFRESLFRIFYALSQEQPVTPEVLQPLNDALERGNAWRVLTVKNGLPAWGWKHCSTVDELATMLVGRLAVQAESLLTGPDLQHLKCCSSLECDWLFLDSSKNKQRRWCQMSVCGSREKLNRLKHAGGAL
ncbi:CGNR zinc finger domain-containing protein [Pseudomonas sp. NPDC089734]|uniref:CGNR zinc finger domain-containing protein n=1 Tax=Pseudomonas sp. NPDC089734 TaxID=3364469 RepID=UPI0037F26587